MPCPPSGLADPHRRHRRRLPAPGKDRIGARWSLTGADAVLRLRALIANGDLDACWSYHLEQERRRVHRARYASPDAAFSEFALAA